MDVPRPQTGMGRNANVKRYVIAFLAGTVAILQQSFASRIDHTVTLFLLLGAAVAAAAYGGLLPCLAAIGLGIVATFVGYERFDRLAAVMASDAILLVSFVLVGVFVGAACEMLHRRYRRAELGSSLAEALLATAATEEVHDREAIEGVTEANARLRRAFRAARVMVWEWDLPSGLVTHEATEEVFGLASVRSPLPVKRALMLIHPEHRAEVVARVQSAVEHREPFVHHLRLIGNGSTTPLWVENHGAVVCDDAGQPVCVTGAIIDITAHKLAADALVAADKRKDAFLATLAHEFRNPLTAIGVAAQLLKAPAANSPEMNTCSNMIRRQADHLGRLVDDLLDISRIVHDRLELRRERIDLRSVITTSLEAVGELRHTHQLTVTLPLQPVELSADPVRLAQLFGNLLANARKYTPDGGLIQVTVEQVGAGAVARVRDSGIGIAPEELAHVFEPFYQVNSSLAHADGGLGIGLALARRIAQLHGGTVEVRSAGLGCGSEFVIQLPLLPPTAGESRPQRPPASGSIRSDRPCRILVADDSADVAEAMALALRMCGHEVAVALDGLEALRVADEFRPQVALLDVRMPKRAGSDVALEIRKTPWAQETGVLLVALTGWNADDLKKRVDMSAFDLQVVKPTDIDVIRKVIERAQRRSRNGTT
jgi:PAS domain S-box-containing protein